MEVLVSELGVLLKMLDQESLSSSTEEKKMSVWNLLQQIQPQGSGTDYIYMNSSVYRNGTSFVESLFESFDCEIGDLKEVTDELKLDKDTQTDILKQDSTDSPASHSADSPPPLPTTPPPEEYYEEAVPLSPGTLPEYIITRVRPVPPLEEGYEEAENHYPTTCINSHRKNSYNDSDALSSSYESYEEDEEDRSPGVRLTHQWPSEEMSSVPPARDCRICAFLLRKKRFGQWAKQLTVIRENRLQCYKSSKDTTPYVDLLLPQCTVVYAPKDSKRKHHELRFTLPNGDGLVLAVQSKEQAHRWLRVVREVSGQCVAPDDASPVISRKNELDKRLSAERNTSDSDSVGVSAGEACKENGKVKRGAFAAGRKITRIISFSKKKCQRQGAVFNDPRQGFMLVLVNQVWREQWCCVSKGHLRFYNERGDPRTSLPSVPLHDCEVAPGLGPKHPFAFRIMKYSNEVAALEASSSEEMGRWLGVLLAESGSLTDPESLHYDYVDVDTIANIRDAVRHSFLSPDYDEVPNEDMQSEQNGKRRSSFSSSDSDRTKPSVSLKRSGSNANQYGRYGKTRAEEDAKRFLKEKEELEKEKDGIRKALLVLRQEKKMLKEELKTAMASNKKHQNVYIEGLPVNCASELRRRPPSVYASSTGTVMQKAKEWESKKGT
ncbi:hypothetical protein WMY93_009467 [Mugilogobius chulae]|uniref:Actin filament-associated protein 1-like 1 n=1 Tax=Mugilogobius chulae TaxID=88201 RepID=A0AAW0PM89_9GOBI